MPEGIRRLATTALALVCLAPGAAAADSLITTYNNDNSGHSGCIFDVVALQDVTINSFDTNVSAGLGGTCDADVWFMHGSGYADATNPGAWTTLGSASGVSPAGSGNPTPIPIAFEIEIHAGDTASFYVEVGSCPLFGGLRYSWGDALGDVVAQDAYIQVLDGFCLDSFSNADEPRTWNGTVHYTPGLLCLGVDDDGDGFTDCDDCDETDPTVYPGAPELCDGIDNDCDGIVGDAVDGDGDGVTACDGDCDDAEAEAYPGNPEVCDGIDNDCNGTADDGVSDDLDGDGVNTCQGDCDDSDPAVYPGADDECDGVVDADCGNDLYLEIDDDQDGYAECEGDCDDGTSLVHPGHAEECDGLDNDCDPLTDENADVDGDGQTPCGGDCDDGNALVYFGADDVCDGFDNDCDGEVDNGFDGDGDGYSPCGDGDPDCDDEDPSVNPGAEEIPYDGIDNDCDEGDLTDVDGDGFDGGGPLADDCDDLDPFVHPDAEEICDDGADNDCDAHYDGDDADCFGGDDDDSASPADEEPPLGACFCSPNTGAETSMAAVIGLGVLWVRRRFPLSSI